MQYRRRRMFCLPFFLFCFIFFVLLDFDKNDINIAEFVNGAEVSRRIVCYKSWGKNFSFNLWILIFDLICEIFIDSKTKYYANK